MSSLSQEPVRLSIETENDSLNHSCDLVERGRRWLASQEAGLTEADLRVKLAIDLEWMTEDHFVQFDLSVSPRHVADENDWEGSAEHVESSAERNLNGNEVLVWISNGPKGVEDVISVAVGFGAAPRPERYEVRKEGGGKIGEALTLMSVPQGTPQVGLTLTEGKRAFLNTPIRLQHAGSGIRRLGRARS